MEGDLHVPCMKGELESWDPPLPTRVVVLGSTTLSRAGFRLLRTEGFWNPPGGGPVKNPLREPRGCESRTALFGVGLFRGTSIDHSSHVWTPAGSLAGKGVCLAMCRNKCPILCMDKILQHFQTMGNHSLLVFAWASSFQGFLGCAKWNSSIHSINSLPDFLDFKLFGQTIVVATNKFALCLAHLGK